MITLDQTVEIIIDTPTWDRLRVLAEKRNAAKRAHTTKRFAKNLSDVDIHHVGLASEWAFAWETGLTSAQDASASGDSGHDFTLPSGLTVDVKYRGQQMAGLAINGTDPDRHFRADSLALVWKGSRPRSMILVGWIERDDFLAKAKRVKLASWRLAVDWHHLRPINELRQMARAVYNADDPRPQGATGSSEARSADR